MPTGTGAPTPRTPRPLVCLVLVAWIAAALLLEWVISGGVGFLRIVGAHPAVGALSATLRDVASRP